MREHKEEQNEIDALKADVARLREDLRAIASDLKAFAGAAPEEEAGEGTTGSAWQRSRREWAEFQQKLREAREQGEHAAEELTEEIRRHPLTSVAIAAGVGYLIARILSIGGRR